MFFSMMGCLTIAGLLVVAMAAILPSEKENGTEWVSAHSTRERG